MPRWLIAAACALLPSCLGVTPEGQPISLIAATVQVGDPPAAGMWVDGIVLVAWGQDTTLDIYSKAPEIWQVPESWPSDIRLDGKVFCGRALPEAEYVVVDWGAPLPAWASGAPIYVQPD